MPYDYNDDAYSQLLEDANKDDRVGDHDWMVTSVVHDQWPSGDDRIRLVGSLLDIPKAKADLTISPPPAPDIVAAESKTWDHKKKRAIAATITMYRQLAQHYKTSPENIKEGEMFRVKIVKTKVVDGKGGFLRVVSFLDKKEMSEAAQAQESVPF
jgi:hypothetical protein